MSGKTRSPECNPSEITKQLTRVQSVSPAEVMEPGSFRQAISTHLFVSDFTNEEQRIV